MFVICEQFAVFFARNFTPSSPDGVERVRLRNQSNSAICLPPPPALSWLMDGGLTEEHGLRLYIKSS